MAKITTRMVAVELAFVGDGRVVERPRGTFRGGVPDPDVSAAAGFNVLPEVEHDHGGVGPVPETGGYAGALQVNLWGTSGDYRALGRHLLALAELDASADPGFHQHYDELRSADGRTQVHLILRKIPEPLT
jgi:hypothetical protein